MQALKSLPRTTASQHPRDVATAGGVHHEDARASRLPCRNTSQRYGGAMSDDPHRPKPLRTA
jgi:hypothetical protein